MVPPVSLSLFLSPSIIVQTRLDGVRQWQECNFVHAPSGLWVYVKCNLDEALFHADQLINRTRFCPAKPTRVFFRWPGVYLLWQYMHEVETDFASKGSNYMASVFGL